MLGLPWAAETQVPSCFQMCPHRLRQGSGMQALAAKHKLEARLAREAFPLDYSTALRVVRDALLGIAPAPVVVSEGANTMDNAR